MSDGRTRVAILADYLEEGWTSMDDYAGMLSKHLARIGRWEPSLVRPDFQIRLGRLSWLLGPRLGHVLDRYLNRYIDYPNVVAGLPGFDLHHVVDHTYAGLTVRAPAGRTIVTCHDLDFADPPTGTRHAWLVRSTSTIALRGIQAAARVICVSESTRTAIVRRGLVEPRRIAVIYQGVADEFNPDGPILPEVLEARLPRVGPRILHVGGMVARKRIDLLLRTFAFVRRHVPETVLLRVGGALSPEMVELSRRLGVENGIVEMPFLSRSELAALYRTSDLFFLCSDREGFGMPVLEAMASGLPVVSRELPAVQEVAGDAIRLVPGADPEGMAAAVVAVVRDQGLRASLRERGLERAAEFSWARTAESTARVYEEVLQEAPIRRARYDRRQNTRR